MTTQYKINAGGYNSFEERRTKNEERRTKNEERRTKNEERRTKNEERLLFIPYPP